MSQSISGLVTTPVVVTNDELVKSTGPVVGSQLMRQEESGRGGPIGPLDWRKVIPFQAIAASDRLGWGWRRLASVRHPPGNTMRPPLRTTGSSLSRGRPKNWIYGLRG
jgi:hypothetical protein